MDGVSIRGSGRQARLPLAALPLLLCGVWGFLLVFQSLDGVSFDTAPAFLTASALLGLLWAGQRYGGRWFLPSLLAAAGLWLLAGQAWTERAGTQAAALLGFWFGDRVPALAERFGMVPPESVTELAVLLAVLLSLALFLSECLLGDHEIPYTLATALLVYVPLLGLRADMWAVFLLALFRLALRAAQNAVFPGGRCLLPDRERTRLAGQCAVILCVLLALSFLAAVSLVQRRADALYAPAYRAEELAVRGLKELGERRRGRTGGGLDGKIGGGNQYHLDSAQLELSASDCPAEPLYLRAFAGGDYAGGEWAAADDDAIFQAIQPEMMPEDPESWSGSAASWFNGMYYEMNYELHNLSISRYLYSSLPTEDARFSLHLIPPRTLRLRNLAKGDSNVYTPYYSYPMAAWVASPGGSYALFGGSAYGFLYYQQDETQVDWALLEEVNHGMAAWDRAFQDAYLRQAREVYTRVPEERVPRLAELVRANPLSDLNEISAFILHTLHSRAVYSLTPGRSPGNRDVVEDFLFEKGKGYCQHFAAAATLLYRLYGVPARYAAGFVALPSAFQPVHVDGTEANGWGTTDAWYAKITDRAAHAWVEIFLDGYGWTPVEVTPASAASAAGTQAAAAYPGFDKEVQAEIDEDHGWTNPPSDTRPDGGHDVQSRDGQTGGGDYGYPADPETPGGTGGGRQDGAGQESGTPPATLRHDGGVRGYLAFFLFTALLLFPPILIRRRDQMLARLDAMDCREAVWRLGNLLRFAGTPVDEEDYAERLAETVPVLTPEEAERLAAAAERAAFGQRPPGPEEDAFARDLYRRTARWVYGTLDRRRRLVFRWAAVYG